jgi:hypothetical protein
MSSAIPKGIVMPHHQTPPPCGNGFTGIKPPAGNDDSPARQAVDASVETVTDQDSS